MTHGVNLLTFLGETFFSPALSFIEAQLIAILHKLFYDAFLPFDLLSPGHSYICVASLPH